MQNKHLNTFYGIPHLIWQMRTPFFMAMIFFTVNMMAQPPATLWTKTFGGSNIDVGHAVQQTTDGGYIITGYTRSYGTMSGRNFWLLKTDSSGTEKWNNAFGGNDDEEAYSVQQTTDGGYIIAGYTKSFGAGSNDVLLIKTDSSGNSEWTRTFGGAQDDEGYSVQQTTDGGYIITGVTSSSGAGSRDVWLIKTYPSGYEEWSRTLGGFGSDGAWSVQQTLDGGFILTGWTYSNGPGFLGNAWLVKTDTSGIEEWNQFFGGDDVDRGYSVQQTNDGGYILTGYTSSSGAGLYDVLLIKTDSSGTEEWNKTFGGTGRDYGNAVQQTSDGGYIVAGYTLSFGAGGDDVWVIKTDSSGNEDWNNTYGGSSSDVGYDIQQTTDGGYIVVGHTLSAGAGLHDVYLIRIASETAPVFTVNPDSLLFGNVSVGDTLIDSLMVKNTGNTDLIITSATSSNPLFTVFPNSITIAPDSTAQFYVQFRADTLPISQQGVLVFHHNGLTSPDSIIVKADVVTGIIDQISAVPQKFRLRQNYPNPFNPTTTIEFTLPNTEFVTLKIYNILGKEMATLVSEKLLAGKYQYDWDAGSFASSIYLYKLEAGNFVKTKKMILLK